MSLGKRNRFFLIVGFGQLAFVIAQPLAFEVVFVVALDDGLDCGQVANEMAVDRLLLHGESVVGLVVPNAFF